MEYKEMDESKTDELKNMLNEYAAEHPGDQDYANKIWYFGESYFLSWFWKLAKDRENEAGLRIEDYYDYFLDMERGLWGETFEAVLIAIRAWTKNFMNSAPAYIYNNLRWHLLKRIKEEFYSTDIKRQDSLDIIITDEEGGKTTLWDKTDNYGQIWSPDKINNLAVSDYDILGTRNIVVKGADICTEQNAPTAQWNFAKRWVLYNFPARRCPDGTKIVSGITDGASMFEPYKTEDQKKRLPKMLTLTDAELERRLLDKYTEPSDLDILTWRERQRKSTKYYFMPTENPKK